MTSPPVNEVQNIGANQKHWRKVWDGAKHLASFLSANHALWRGSTVLELGSGSGLVGIVMGKLGASRVVLTDYPNEQGLDWQSQDSVAAVVDELLTLDFIVASDIFYDVCTFKPLIQTITTFVDKFPKIRMYFSYAERNDNWSIEDLLLLNNLQCSAIRVIDSTNTLYIGVIFRRDITAIPMFCGIEGGGSVSNLVFIDTNGNTVGVSNTGGTNYCLDGREKTADSIATWIRECAKNSGIQLPLKGLESEPHKYRGAILVAGTGSSCRILLENGSVIGVGGWGHIIGDGGSGYWIANRAIRILFDDDDGLSPACAPTDVLRELFLKHFHIKDKVEILEYLYSKFQKSYIASFTIVLAEHANDPVIAKLFFDAGEILGKHFRVAVSRLPEESRNNIPLTLVGSVFKSWNLLKDDIFLGFISALSGSSIHHVSLWRSAKSSAAGAAVLVARQIGISVPHSSNADNFETIEF
uniref:N-acetyl-D-glucosamine kinase n=1 Tax=Heterorhabditis bacteriophora TaxID=37862 RepID=A0A1I7XTA5_HETBA